MISRLFRSGESSDRESLSKSWESCPSQESADLETLAIKRLWQSADSDDLQTLQIVRVFWSWESFQIVRVFSIARVCWSLDSHNQKTLTICRLWRSSESSDRESLFHRESLLNFGLSQSKDSVNLQTLTICRLFRSWESSARELNGGIESLRLVFNNDTLVELESQDGQQQKSLLLFSEIQQNHSLPADTFIFVRPEGYELDDQR